MYRLDVHSDGESEQLDVGIVAVPLPISGFHIVHVRMEDLLVLSVHEGDGDGSVVEKKAVGLPCSGSTLHPVVLFVKDVIVQSLDIMQPEVDDTMLLAGSVTMGRMAGQHGHLQAEGKRVPHPHIS